MSILESAEEVGRSNSSKFFLPVLCFFKHLHITQNHHTFFSPKISDNITRCFLSVFSPFQFKKVNFFFDNKNSSSFLFRWLSNDDKITQISFCFTDKLQFQSISSRLRWNCRRRCRLLQSLQRFWVRPRMCSFKSNSGPGAIWRRLWRFLLAPYRTRWHSCGCENM